ncbi:hypothetical protein ABVT39_004639 [Epinephelus coioides]
MFSLETFERQISAVMETVVEAAVTELGRLLEKRSANVMAAQQRSAPLTTSEEEEEEEESEVTPQCERHLFNKAITNQFASLMQALTKSAVDKVLMMLKVSLCEAEDGSAAEGEQRAGLNNKVAQTNMNPAAGQVAEAKQPVASTHESNSGSLSDAEALTTELASSVDRSYCFSSFLKHQQLRYLRTNLPLPARLTSSGFHFSSTTAPCVLSNCD